MATLACAQREPAFSFDQLLILHVKSMFGKYMQGVAACHVFLVYKEYKMFRERFPSFQKHRNIHVEKLTVVTLGLTV